LQTLISATATQLFVADVAASCDFFTKVLGFELVLLSGAPPFYARTAICCCSQPQPRWR
jgi:hypothetical protein